ALRGPDGELRLLARRGRAQPRALLPRAPHRRLAAGREAGARVPAGRASRKERCRLSEGRLAENVMHFARLLRAAGLRIGSDRVIDCVRALEIAGAQRRDDWYWTMSAVLLSRQEQRPIFDQAFQIFWRDPKLTERMMQMLLPQAYGRAARPEQQQSQRLTDALFSQQREAREKDAERLDIEARLTFSSREVLQRMDFDTMSAAELAEAKKMIARLRLPLPMIRTRRFRPERAGRRIDLRATLRESLRECNFKWARRTLGQNACVLLVSDGLDREAGEGLGEEMERLAKSSRYLVWLNPLLRYDKFEARPAGVRAILPHVDLFLPVHNL